jgi:hypothetical protein
MPARLLAVVLLSVVALPLCVPLPGRGCAVAPRRGERIHIADESAIIIWSSASKTQHFIRRASFTAGDKAKDFGFLVPVPSYPEVEPASDEAFQTFERITAPRTVTERRRVDLLPQLGCGGAKAPAKKGDKVQVLQEKCVGGHDAVVLEAKEADALSNWLNKWGYQFAPELKGWAEVYVRQGWKFAAFKVARDEKGEHLATSAVRLTFPADRPYFPYREPEGPAPSPDVYVPRRLRIYFVADARYKGTLKGQTWPASVSWSNRIAGEDRATLLKQVTLPADTAPDEWWMTEFEDTSSPRPGHDDVYFERDGDQSTRERRPNVVVTEPWVIDYVLAALVQWSCCYGPFLVLGLVWGVMRWRRRNK